MKAKSVQSVNPFKSVIQMAYDIIKARGGEIKVESKEGEGTTFIILLPVDIQYKNHVNQSIL